MSHHLLDSTWLWDRAPLVCQHDRAVTGWVATRVSKDGVLWFLSLGDCKARVYA